MKADTKSSGLSKKQCPMCGSTNIAEIIYGLVEFVPGDEVDKELIEGKIVLGGCCVESNSSTHHCNSCEYEFSSMDIKIIDIITNNNSILLNGYEADRHGALPRIVKWSRLHYPPEKMKYIIFDFRQADFQLEGEDYDKQRLLYGHVITKPEEALIKLRELSVISGKRAKGLVDKDQTILVFISECDAAAANQELFDSCVININKSSKVTNMKLVYFTTAKTEYATSKALKDSFDLIVSDENIDEYIS